MNLLISRPLSPDSSIAAYLSKMSLPTVDTLETVVSKKTGTFSKKPRLPKQKKDHITPIRLYPRLKPPTIRDHPDTYVQKKIKIVKTCFNGADTAVTTGDVLEKLVRFPVDNQSLTIRMTSMRVWNITNDSRSSHVILVKPSASLVQSNVPLEVYSDVGTNGEPATIGVSYEDTMSAQVNCVKGSSDVIIQVNCDGDGTRLVEDQYVVIEFQLDVLY